MNRMLTYFFFLPLHLSCLYGSFTSGALLNFVLLLQALYFGMVEEQKSIVEIFKGDFSSERKEGSEKEEEAKDSIVSAFVQTNKSRVQAREKAKATVK